MDFLGNRKSYGQLILYFEICGLFAFLVKLVLCDPVVTFNIVGSYAIWVTSDDQYTSILV